MQAPHQEAIENSLQSRNNFAREAVMQAPHQEDGDAIDIPQQERDDDARADILQAQRDTNRMRDSVAQYRRDEVTPSVILRPPQRVQRKITPYLLAPGASTQPAIQPRSSHQARGGESDGSISSGEGRIPRWLQAAISASSLSVEREYVRQAARHWKAGKLHALPELTPRITQQLREYLLHTAEEGDVWPPPAIYLVQQRFMEQCMAVRRADYIESGLGLFARPGAIIRAGTKMFYTGILHRYSSNHTPSDQTMAVDECNWYIDGADPVYLPGHEVPVQSYLPKANSWIWEDGSNDIDLDAREKLGICVIQNVINVEKGHQYREICMDYGPEDTSGQSRPTSFTWGHVKAELLHALASTLMVCLLHTRQQTELVMLYAELVEYIEQRILNQPGHCYHQYRRAIMNERTRPEADITREMRTHLTYLFAVVEGQYDVNTYCAELAAAIENRNAAGTINWRTQFPHVLLHLPEVQSLFQFGIARHPSSWDASDPQGAQAAAEAQVDRCKSLCRRIASGCSWESIMQSCNSTPTKATSQSPRGSALAQAALRSAERERVGSSNGPTMEQNRTPQAVGTPQPISTLTRSAVTNLPMERWTNRPDDGQWSTPHVKEEADDNRSNPSKHSSRRSTRSRRRRSRKSSRPRHKGKPRSHRLSRSRRSTRRRSHSRSSTQSSDASSSSTSGTSVSRDSIRREEGTMHGLASETHQRWQDRRCSWMVGEWDGRLNHSYPQPRDEMFMSRADRNMNEQFARYSLVDPIYNIDMSTKVRQEMKEVNRPTRLPRIRQLYDGSIPIHEYMNQLLMFYQSFNTYYYWIAISLRDGAILEPALQSQLTPHRHSRRWRCLTRKDVEKRNVKDCVEWLEELILCYLVLFGQDTPATTQDALDKINTLTLPEGQTLTGIHKLFLELKAAVRVLPKEYLTLSKLVKYITDAILRTGGRYAEANCDRFRQFIDFHRALLERGGSKPTRNWCTLEWLEDACLEMADNEEQRASQRAMVNPPQMSRVSDRGGRRRFQVDTAMHALHHQRQGDDIENFVDPTIQPIWDDEEFADDYYREGKIISLPEDIVDQPVDQLWSLLHEMTITDIDGVTEEPVPRKQQLICPVCGMAGHDKISVCRVATDSGKISLDAMSYIRPEQRDYRWLVASEYGALRQCSAEQIKRIKQRTQEIADTRMQMRQQRGYGGGGPAIYGAGARGPPNYNTGGRAAPYNPGARYMGQQLRFQRQQQQAVGVDSTHEKIGGGPQAGERNDNRKT